MALVLRSGLVAGLMAVGLLAAALPSEAGSGCAFAGGSDPGATTLGDGPSGFFTSMSDGPSLGITLGGLGAIAALLAGGAFLGRRLGSPLEAGLESTIETETVLIAEPLEIETEVALALRR